MTSRTGSKLVEPRVHLFVDYSNLWYSALKEAGARGDPTWAMRVNVANLRRFMAAERPIASTFLVANAETPAAALGHFRRSFDVGLVECGRQSGKEQAGDEKLQNEILLTIQRPGPPGTIVLLTADGAGWKDGRGFCPTLAAARFRGFAIEVLAFERFVNRELRLLAEKVGSFVPLDGVYSSITFLEGGPRMAPPLDFGQRSTTIPRRPVGVARQIVLDVLEGRPVDRFGATLRMILRQSPHVLDDWREMAEIAQIVETEWTTARPSDAPFDRTDVSNEALDRQGLHPRRRNKLVGAMKALGRAAKSEVDYPRWRQPGIAPAQS